MGLDEVTAFARERLGMELQSVTRLGARLAGTRRLEVWSLMTEHGWFWLVDGADQVELLRATRGGLGAIDAATQRFLELHPTGPARRAAVPPAAPLPAAIPTGYDCHTCGVRVTPRRPSGQAVCRLCERCYHAERERERYDDDPEYRARHRARRAAHRQRGREVGEP